MTVGEALAEARTRAGLSVDEVSERTKIREKVIQGIERDDFEACGGDLFVRGYVRVIAGAVGLDAQPLIREYDKSHQSGTLITPVRPAPETLAAAAAPAVPVAPKLSAAPVEPAASAEPAVPGPSEAFEHVKILPAVPAVCPEPAVGEPPANGGPPPVGELPPVGEPPADGEPVGEGEPAVIDLTRIATPGHELVPLRIQPGPPIHPSLTRHGWRRRIRDRRRELVVVVLAIVVLAAAAIAGVRIASSLIAGSKPDSGAARQAPAAANPAPASPRPGERWHGRR